MIEQELAAEVAALEVRRLPELSGRPIRRLADNLLHQDWHPTTPGVAFAWAWTGEAGERTVNFTEQGNLRKSLFSVVGDAVDQVVALVQRLTDAGPAET